MSLAIGMVELNSIARGIETCDYMVKAAQIDLLRSSTVCPGKFLILVGGDTSDVEEAMKEGLHRGGECVVDAGFGLRSGGSAVILLRGLSHHRRG